MAEVNIVKNDGSEWQVIEEPNELVLKSGERLPNLHAYIQNKNGLTVNTRSTR